MKLEEIKEALLGLYKVRTMEQKYEEEYELLLEEAADQEE